MLQLPELFTKRMEQELGRDLKAFLESYNEPRTYGLRLNLLKTGPEDTETFPELQRMFGLRQVPWCSSGFYYDSKAKPGKHPFHAAGVYYIQEPSAMSAVELLSPKPGEIVLDLAAAPGGKTTQIASAMQGRGLLIANEIHPARAAVLSENIERSGIRNAIVTNASPDKLSVRFPAFFDKVLLDAPCSGEGMFRKDPDTMNEWSTANTELCAVRQSDILREAAVMVKPGGTLVYSTCTFSRMENEQVIEAFIGTHPEFETMTMERIWPHLHEGEGHFVAVLMKREETKKIHKPGKNHLERNHRAKLQTTRDAMKLFEAFRATTLPNFDLRTGVPILFGDQLYWLPQPEQSRFDAGLFEGLKVPRPGLHLATLKKQRAEPAHALAMAVNRDDSQAAVTYTLGSSEIDAYLRGEPIPSNDAHGWTPVFVEKFPIGWGKASGGIIKNHYPKGLRSFV